MTAQAASAPESTALALAPCKPSELMRLATDAAHVAKQIVLATANDIQGRRFVRCEGWQAIAVAHGCALTACNVEVIPGGVRAIGEVRRMADGALIASGEGFVGEDEPTWFGGESRVWDKRRGEYVLKQLPRRHDYAIRAMAQTRAMSRAGRSAFAHVVVLIDAKLSTTPAEEVPAGGFDDAIDAESTPVSEGAAPADPWDTVLHFGKHQGKPLKETPEDYREWLFGKWLLEKRGEKKPLRADDEALAAALETLSMPVSAEPAGEAAPPPWRLVIMATKGPNKGRALGDVLGLNPYAKLREMKDTLAANPPKSKSGQALAAAIDRGIAELQERYPHTHRLLDRMFKSYILRDALPLLLKKADLEAKHFDDIGEVEAETIADQWDAIMAKAQAPMN